MKDFDFVRLYIKITRVVPLPNGLNGLQMGVTKYLLSGMILQNMPESYTEQNHSTVDGSIVMGPIIIGII